MPISNDEIISAAPKSMLAGMSAFISSWFGIEHYLAKSPTFMHWFTGHNGERLIPSESAMVGDLCKVIHYWKANGGRTDGVTTYSVEDTLQTLKSTVSEYGLKHEEGIVDGLLAREKTWLNNKTIAGPRDEIRTILLNSDSKFFGLMREALREDIPRNSKSQQKITNNAVDIYNFFHEHNHKAIKALRNPVAIAVTGAAVATTAMGLIRDTRVDTQLTETLRDYQGKLDELSQDKSIG